MVLKRKKTKDTTQQPPIEPVPEEEPLPDELGEMIRFEYQGKTYEVPPQVTITGMDRALRYGDQMARLRRRLHYEEPRDSLLVR